MPTLVYVVSLLAAVVAGAAGVMVLRRRRISHLALPLGVMLAGASLWSACRGSLLVTGASVPATITLRYLVFVGVALVAGASFWYFAVLSGHRLTRRSAAMLMVHPTVLLCLLLSDSGREAFLHVDTVGTTVVVGHTPLFWLHTAYCFGLLVTGIGRASAAMGRAIPRHRHVFAVAALGAALPLAGCMVGLVFTIGPGDPDLTPVCFLFSAAMWWWVERFGQHSTTVPVSTRRVLDILDDAVVVLDARGSVIDANPAARCLLGGGLDDTSLAEGDAGVPWRRYLDADQDRHDRGTLVTSTGTVLDVRVIPMSDALGRSAGVVVVLRDVTEMERLRAELVDQATHDWLTGLNNRRVLEHRLASAVGHATSSGQPLSMVLVDVDHFKAVNDEHGHSVGDRLLAQIGRVLEASAGPDETAARLGGEEFVLLLPGYAADDAARRADDLRARCARITLPTATGTVGATVSAGVATLAPGWSPDDMLRAADDAMYAAKAAGRDRVAHAPLPV
ncbi:diguanylate cyclase domain-containing protein [Cellulomonas sp. URHE0023]|uniref:histidine kinase N-terminal 7TM domain-containing diguanylate cyclase n=1 Tax=Cellulomonas sp. URHE0023 TaxID=1380354 RepID=UPI000484A1A2|nr:diguanylate cyclase [Cellulomonas sp. URHE0023]